MKSSRRILHTCIAVIAALVAMAQVLPGTSSSFTGTTSNTGNSASAAADWTAPTVATPVIQKSEGGMTGTIRQGGTFYVYANVTDNGNPASGVNTVTASVTNVATVTTATMTSGSYTANGTSYNYRSASLTAKNPLSSASYSYSVSATDVAGNASSASTANVTVDNTAFDGDNLSWTDNGTVNKFDAGDVLKFVYTKTVDPDSIVSGWNGSANTSYRVAIVDSSVYGTATDLVAIGDATLTTQVPLGTLSLGGNYISSGIASFNSTMTASGNTITVTLGSVVSGSASLLTATTPTPGSWTPMAGANDAAGNVASNSNFTQFGESSFTTTNKSGGIAGKPEAGDKVTFTYDDSPLLSSIISGWTSGSKTVYVRINNVSSLDTLTIYDSANTTQVPLGAVALNGNYVSNNMTFSASTMTASGGAISITLGTANNTTYESTDSTAHKAIWTPDDAVTDLLGAPGSQIPTNPSTSVVGF